MRSTPILALLAILLLCQCSKTERANLGYFELQVVDAHGVKQSGVEVQLYDEYRWPHRPVASRVVHSAPDPAELARTSLYRYTTDHEGKVNLPLLSDATAVVCSTDTHYGVVYAGDLEPQVLRLKLEETLLVEVVHFDGKPAVGVGVGLFHAVHPDDAPHADVAVFTDQDGKALIPHLQDYVPFREVVPMVRVLGFFAEPIQAPAYSGDILRKGAIKLQLPELVRVELTLAEQARPLDQPHPWISMRDPIFPAAPDFSFMPLSEVTVLPPIEVGRRVELRLYPGHQGPVPSAIMEFLAIPGQDGWMRLKLEVEGSQPRLAQ
ncbi:MAG: hypothetical protein ACPG31_02545 [Planctomycetota bacterium]